MNRQQILDLYFLDARHKLIDLAAFLDRVGRAEGVDDFRLVSFRAALREVAAGQANLAERVLMVFSDPTSEPIPVALTKAAAGAWDGLPAPSKAPFPTNPDPQPILP